MIEAFGIGNLVRDPELRQTQGGHQMCSFTLACRTNQRDTNNEPITEFIQVTTFGRQAENAAKFLTKGSKAAVSGAFNTRAYTAKDGTNRTALQITADRLEFLSSNNQQGQQGGGQQQATRQRTQNAALPPVDDPDELPF